MLFRSYGRKRKRVAGAYRRAGVQVRLHHADRHRADPERVGRGGRAPDFRQKGRAGLDDRAARGGFPSLAYARASHVGPPDYTPNRFPGYYLLCGAQAQEAVGVDGRGRSRAEAHVRQAGYSLRGADGLGRRRRRCRHGFRFGEDHFQGDPRRDGHRLLFDLRGAARLSRPGAQVPRERRALYR